MTSMRGYRRSWIGPSRHRLAATFSGTFVLRSTIPMQARISRSRRENSTRRNADSRSSACYSVTVEPGVSVRAGVAGCGFPRCRLAVPCCLDCLYANPDKADRLRGSVSPLGPNFLPVLLREPPPRWIPPSPGPNGTPRRPALGGPIPRTTTTLPDRAEDFRHDRHPGAAAPPRWSGKRPSILGHRAPLQSQGSVDVRCRQLSGKDYWPRRADRAACRAERGC